MKSVIVFALLVVCACAVPTPDMKWTAQYGSYPTGSIIPLRYGLNRPFIIPQPGLYPAQPLTYPQPYVPISYGSAVVRSYDPEYFYKKNGFYPEN